MLGSPGWLHHRARYSVMAHVILCGQEEFMVGHLVFEIQHPIAIWKLEGWKRVELIKSSLNHH